MVGKDREGKELNRGDLVLVDFRNKFRKNSRSLYRSIGEVVVGNTFGYKEEEYFVRVEKPQDGEVVYLDVDSWNHHFEKIEKEFSESIISLYF